MPNPSAVPASGEPPALYGLPELRKDRWEQADRRLLAKMIGEFAYLGIVRPDPEPEPQREREPHPEPQAEPEPPSDPQAEPDPERTQAPASVPSPDLEPNPAYTSVPSPAHERKPVHTSVSSPAHERNPSATSASCPASAPPPNREQATAGEQHPARGRDSAPPGQYAPQVGPDASQQGPCAPYTLHTLCVDAGGSLSFRFRARRTAYDSWRVDPASLSLTEGGEEPRPLFDPLGFLSHARGTQGLDGATLGHVFRKLSTKLAADARLDHEALRVSSACV